MSDYDITRIPGIMRRTGWTKGAMLMESWFSRPANDHPERERPDTTTITMSWALGFDRARRVYDEIVSEKIWVNGKAQQLLAAKLRQQGKLVGQEVAFGGPMTEATRLEPDHIQHRPVGSMFDPADDMLAALGRFTFHVAVAGHVVPRGQRHTVRIEEVGIYIWDTYDFNGEQSLGYWSDTDFAGRLNPIGGSSVGNASFRAFRATHNRGGDFLVFSDVRVFRPHPADTFDV